MLVGDGLGDTGLFGQSRQGQGVGALGPDDDGGGFQQLGAPLVLGHALGGQGAFSRLTDNLRFVTYDS